MTATAIFASLSIITALPIIQKAQAPAPSFTHSDQIAAYASATVCAEKAEKLCSGYRRNQTNMAALRTWMEIQDADKLELSRETTAAERKMAAQIKAVGASSWCSSIVGLFGPEGTGSRVARRKMGPSNPAALAIHLIPSAPVDRSRWLSGFSGHCRTDRSRLSLEALLRGAPSWVRYSEHIVGNGRPASLAATLTLSPRRSAPVGDDIPLMDADEHLDRGSQLHPRR